MRTVGGFHMHLKTTFFKIVFQDIFAVSGKSGIHVNRDQLVIDRCSTLQLTEQMYKRVRILASRDSNSNAITILNKFEVTNRLTGQLFNFAKMGIIEQQRKDDLS
jgi:hypothetical protein